MHDLPPLPKPDKRGRALEYARISLARDLIRNRKGLGLSQQRLAELAGVRQETLSRIETGKHTASQRTIEKLMRAVDVAADVNTGGDSRPATSRPVWPQSFTSIYNPP